MGGNFHFCQRRLDQTLLNSANLTRTVNISPFRAMTITLNTTPCPHHPCGVCPLCATATAFRFMTSIDLSDASILIAR